MIYFYNHTEAPIEALVTLGVSVKSEGSIGYFGTGFKFALATLLRTGHKVWLNGQPFGVREASIRGQSFQIVTFQGRDLGFTTDLGKNWKVWQAFREFHANALDEGGNSGRQEPHGYATIIAVKGDEIETAFDERHKIFLDTPVLFADESVSIHSGSTIHAYYRGVRAGGVRKPALYTYNLLRSASLSDDRTLLHNWIIEDAAAQLIAASDNEDLIEEAIIAEEMYLESVFSYRNANPSETFLRCVKRNRNHGRLNSSALELYLEHSGEKNKPSESIELTPQEEKLLKEALALCSKLGAFPKDMIFVDTLGPDILGMVRKREIYIARAAFDQGVRRLASTIYEEWLHQQHHLEDCSRSMQNYLFDKLFALLDERPALTATRNGEIPV